MNGLVGARRFAAGRRRADWDDSAARVGRRRLEPQAVDLLLEVPGGEVLVDLGRDTRVLMAHDPLDGGQVGALYEQQRRGRVAEVVKAKLPDIADREELELAGRAAARVPCCPREPVASAEQTLLIARKRYPSIGKPKVPRP
jgi:hypothetical protein